MTGGPHADSTDGAKAGRTWPIISPAVGHAASGLGPAARDDAVPPPVDLGGVDAADSPPGVRPRLRCRSGPRAVGLAPAPSVRRLAAFQPPGRE